MPRPRPISLTKNLSQKMEDQVQPWTRSPTKADVEPNAPKWQLMPSGDFLLLKVLSLYPKFSVVFLFSLYSSKYLMEYFQIPLEEPCN